MTSSSLPTARVGKTDTFVTKLGLGTAPLGNLYRPISDEQAETVIHSALENGIHYFDTAPLYGAGKSERHVGAALAQIPRSSYVLSSKVGVLITPNGQTHRDYSRDSILRSIEASLQRLQTDHIDFLLVHDPDNHYKQALDEAFPTLVELRRQGVVKGIGAGMNQWQMEAEFARNVDIDCFLLAGRYTLLEQTALDEFFPLCQQKGISIFLGGVYNSGILATGAIPGARYNYGPAPTPIMERVQRIEAVCARFHVPLNVAALQFPLAHPVVTSLVVGTETSEEVAANLRALQFPIPPELWQALKDEGLLPASAPVPGQQK